MLFIKKIFSSMQGQKITAAGKALRKYDKFKKLEKNLSDLELLIGLPK